VLVLLHISHIPIAVHNFGTNRLPNSAHRMSLHNRV